MLVKKYRCFRLSAKNKLKSLDTNYDKSSYNSEEEAIKALKIYIDISLDGCKKEHIDWWNSVNEFTILPIYVNV